jgi:hypothetical protein
MITPQQKDWREEVEKQAFKVYGMDSVQKEWMIDLISTLLEETRKDMAERIEQAMPLSFNGVKLLSFEKGYNAYHTEALEAIHKVTDALTVISNLARKGTTV